MNQQQAQQWLLQVQDELNQAVAGFNSKGWEHFKKVLMVAGVLAITGYFLLYKTTSSQLSAVKGKVHTLTEINKYAQQYRDLKGQIQGIKDKFPGEVDRKDWLFNRVYNSAREQDIAIDSISSQKETEKSDQPFVKLSIDVSCKGTFMQIGRWLAELEGSAHFIQIESLTISKSKGAGMDEAPSGMNTATVTISTVLPKGIEAL